MEGKNVFQSICLVAFCVVGAIALTFTGCLWVTDSVGLTDSGIATNKLLSDEEQQAQQERNDAKQQQREEERRNQIGEQRRKEAEEKAKVDSPEEFEAKLRQLESKRRSPKKLSEMAIRPSDIPGELSEYPREFQDLVNRLDSKVTDALIDDSFGKFDTEQYKAVYDAALDSFNTLVDTAFQYCREQGPSKIKI